LNAQVYSYSRAKGLFAGVALDGSALTIDRASNGAYYTPGILASEILADKPPTAPESARRYVEIVEHAAPGGSPSAPASSTSSSAAPPPAPAKPANQGALTTYPMEDTKPGAEPPP
jgi:hypothetical protein